MTWQQIPRSEYYNIPKRRVGATISDPGGAYGEPHMLTEWIDEEDRPVVRHQCWPVGHGVGLARPCLFERWVPAVPAPIICPVCDGEQFVVVTEDGPHRITGPCPGCCCVVCEQPTDTPPECKSCVIREDAMQTRRADQ